MDFEEDDESAERDETPDLKFYIGKDNETICAKKNRALQPITKSRHIINIHPSPKGQARHCNTRLECF